VTLVIVRVMVTMRTVRTIRRDPTDDFGRVRTLFVAELGVPR